MTECELLQQILVELMTTNALLGRLLIVGIMLVSISAMICFWTLTRR